MMQIVGWKGLLAASEKIVRGICLALLILVAASLTFMQLGFVGIGVSGSYAAYAMALLAPVAVGSLLFGPTMGAACGATCGTILLAHARMLPLDVYERYFTTPASSVVLLAGAAFVLGLLFAVLLRKEQRPAQRCVRIAAACLAVAAICAVVSQALTAGMLEGYADSIRYTVEDSSFETTSMRYRALQNSTQSNVGIRVATEFALMALSCVAVDAFARYLRETAQVRTMRTAFRLRLVTAVAVAFLVASSSGFVAITLGETDAAHKAIRDELDFLTSQIQEISRLNAMLEDAYKRGQDVGEMEFFTSLSKLTEGYRQNIDGTLLILINGTAMFSNNEGYFMGMSAEEALGSEAVQRLDDLCKTGEMARVPFAEGSVLGQSNEGVSAQLAYMGASAADEYEIVLIYPYSLAFAGRAQTMMWISLMALVLLATLYVVVSRVIDSLARRPLRGTLGSLEKIMEGDLDELVSEASTVEFSMLSAGINATVDALKGWIGEAERRLESELNAARSIQEQALPREFPAFPGVDAVDLYAIMDPAREVGGDFYDFFTIDCDTVGFLIADVSGKGIPASLFMMAAKNEIQNCMCGGMSLAEAISTANDHISAGNDADMFVTVWAATLNWRTGKLVCVNAGHNFPLMRRGGRWEWVKFKGGLVMGVLDGLKYRSQTIALEPGDELVLYTDGVNEAWNAAEEEYGNDRLERFLAGHTDLRPEQMAFALRADVARWAEGAEQSDDVTVLALEYRGTAQPTA